MPRTVQKLNNNSTKPKRDLDRLTKFVAGYCIYNENVVLQVSDHTSPNLMTYGEATLTRVVIDLNVGLCYPHSSKLKKKTERVVFQNWEEEYVFVLAHELRHVDQFYFRVKTQAEVDAEFFAHMVLREYRHYRSKRHD